MADPDLELRKGGGGARARFLSLTLPAFLPFAILFILPKKEGGGRGGVRSATASLFLFISSLFLPP